MVSVNCGWIGDHPQRPHTTRTSSVRRPYGGGDSKEASLRRASDCRDHRYFDQTGGRPSEQVLEGSGQILGGIASESASIGSAPTTCLRSPVGRDVARRQHSSEATDDWISATSLHDQTRRRKCSGRCPNDSAREDEGERMRRSVADDANSETLLLSRVDTMSSYRQTVHDSCVE